MKITIMGVDYDIDKGWTYTKNANETLDSAVVKVSHLANKLDIQPFDNVIIDNSIYLCVDSYQEQQASLDPVIYNYEIHLFSETKKLENIILPNLSITPHKLSDPLTIKGFIQQVWSLYCPRKRGDILKYQLPEIWPDRFNRVCPEKQWTTPTLRDVLNDLFMLCDCIPVMRNNQIEILDLTSKNNPVTNYNYITRSRSSQDYATDLKMNLQNVMQEKNPVKTYTYQTFIANDYILTSDNLMLETQYPILDIKHLWVNWIISDPFGTWASDTPSVDSKPIYIKVDLCNLKLQNDTESYSIVKEKKLYDILPISKFVNVESFGTTSASQYANCKNTCLYFTRGDNKIYGFSQVNKASLMRTGQLLFLILRLCEYSYLKKQGILDRLLTEEQLSSSVINNNNIVGWSFPTFEIEYETTKEVVFSASKTELLRNERTIMDNQTNAWVNAEAQGNLEYQKANRIGNEVVMINQRTIDSPIDIFDYLGDEIVYRTEYQIFDNYIDVNAYATKDYILRDYFTGINSKIRTWVNAQEEAFIRHDLYKYYVEFDEENSYEDTSIVNDTAVYNTTLSIKEVVSSFSTQVFKPINYCLIKCDNYPSPAVYEYFLINVIRRKIGNSIVLTWGFNDNYVAMKTFNFGSHSSNEALKDDGNVFRTDFAEVDFGGVQNPNNSLYSKVFYPAALNNRLGEFGGIPLNAYPYCNHDGNFTDLKIAFMSTINNVTEAGEEHTKFNYWENIIAPIGSNINNQTPVFNFNAKVFKDNKEIITGSLQIEYINTSKNIYIYNDFYELNHLIATEHTQGLSIYAAPNIYATPTIVSDGQVVVSCYDDAQWNNNYSTRVQLRGTLPDQSYYYIYSGNTPLIRTTLKSFYINLLRKRDKEGLL